MKYLRKTVWALLIGLSFQNCAKKAEDKKEETSTEEKTAAREIWTKEQAKDWYGKQEWIVGADFLPSTAINQLEMFQEASFDTATINKELGWAEGIGMNTMRVYLHDLLWQQDSTGFLKRLDTFLSIADKHKIRPVLVLFDSCWDPFPKLGTQRAPKPGVHNSGWVQSPGFNALKDSTQYPRLERYVKGVVGKFADDDRVLAWDIWNEPDNTNNSSYGKVELPNKVDYVLPLMKKAFAWARTENPEQPLTAGIWAGDWTSYETLKPIEKASIDESDVISFHNYDSAQEFEKRIKQLQQYDRPMICTEYMSRGNGSFFEGSLPIAKKYNVGAINWGLVDGKSQTIYPWDSWKKTYTSEPPLWFHDIFRKDGTPYKQAEVDLIKKLTARK
ncbi:Cellulase (glycosyl hydrolase family 5) [Dyadobacter koreensis]|uniref:Cellulase (Glycosyl hydrolase family 5) n=1 Tax=Dyadobacter koreensis TaxID=408657 RepID=A0A1H6ZBH3_9BACT|nr:cellulase family glycosylhydrolase [Dyadobacter koreensis]SEJ50086.1 Cellulase (glycosyl hydrolase family 5) [Dyadobacter koreensis]